MSGPFSSDPAGGSGPNSQPSAKPASAIRPIAQASIHRICSGQVVLDLAGAVKELVENALDAGAINIEVRLKDYGADTIEVADNGSGVAPENHQALTVKYATSKIATFDDLAALGSFGFRGEALSSLCALSESLTVVTRTEREDAGTRLEYDRQGAIVSATTAARAVGTTVTVRGIFQPLPVRHKEFKKNARREYGKALAVLQAYALVSVDARLIVSHHLGNKHAKRATVLHTQGNLEGGVLANVATVFGAKVAQSLTRVDVDLPGGGGCALRGYVSAPTAPNAGRASGDRQFFYVNGRPVDLPRFSKALNELYRSFCATTAANQCPFAVLDFRMPPDAYDVNVTPDKRKVLLHDEDGVLRAARAAVEAAYAPSRYTYDVGRFEGDRRDGETRDATFDARVKAERADEEPHVAPPPPVASSPPRDDDGAIAIARDEPGVSRRSADFASFGLGGSLSGPSAAARRSDASSSRGASTGGAAPRPKQRRLAGFGFTSETAEVALGDGWRAPVASGEASVSRDGDGDGDGDGGDEKKRQLEPETARTARVVSPSATRGDRSVSPSAADEAPGEEQSAGASRDLVKLEPEATDAPRAALAAASTSSIAFSMADLRRSRAELSSRSAARRGSGRSDAAETERSALAAASLATCAEGAAPPPPKPASAAGDDPLGPALGEGDAAATTALERVFKKSDFAKMRVVGQFNLGFILATLGEDLFIVDQHASDEVYNFERLQRVTTLNRQPLIAPARLGLTAAEEQTVRRHADVFLANGFGFCEDAESGATGPPGAEDAAAGCAPGCCLALQSVPFSKGTTFGVADVHELIGMLDDGAYAAPARTQLSVGLGSRRAPATIGKTDDADADDDADDEATTIDGPRTAPDVLRPSRVRAMLAMRACRSSVMIGAALDPRRSRRILRNLATLKAPWNCPHGRPTMRHVADLARLREKAGGDKGARKRSAPGGW